MSKRIPKLKNFLLLPSYLSEEDLEIYIATEIDEMTKYFTQVLKKYQKENDRSKGNTSSEIFGKFEQFINPTPADDLLEKLSSVTDVKGGKVVTNKISALKTKMDLYEMQYHTFMKEIEKQPKGIFKIKEKVNLKKKVKELENIYSTLIKTLKKKMQQMVSGVKERPSVQVDTVIEIVNQHSSENGINNVLFNMKNTAVDIIPTTAAKISTVLEQINAANEDVENLRKIKRDNDKYLQNLKCSLKSRVDPYMKKFQNSDCKQISFDTAERIMSQIERDISFINNEYDNIVDELLQRKQFMSEGFDQLQKLNVFLNILSNKLYEVQLEHRKNTQELLIEKNKVLSNESLCKDDQSAKLSEIERKLNELNNSYNSTFLSLQGQIKEIEEEASAITATGSFPSTIVKRIQNSISSAAKVDDHQLGFDHAKNVSLKGTSVASFFKQFVETLSSKYDFH